MVSLYLKRYWKGYYYYNLIILIPELLECFFSFFLCSLEFAGFPASAVLLFQYFNSALTSEFFVCYCFKTVYQTFFSHDQTKFKFTFSLITYVFPFLY